MSESKDLPFAGTCGFYCGSCGILAAYRKGQEQQRKLATELSKYMKRTVAIQEIQCQGCQDLSKFCWGNACKLKACCRENGHNFCFQCPQFPCEDFAKFSEIYHDIPIQQSNELREMASTNTWLKKMKERWTCSKCGGPVEAETMKCLTCNYNNKNDVMKSLNK